jgi:hypothetical protein
MGKLHELLAVERGLETKHQKTIQEARTAFGQGSLFSGFHRHLKMFDGSDPTSPDEHKNMDATVHEVLQIVKEHGVRFFDAALQKERTNQEARADIVVDGKVLAADLPATFLLGLENKLKALRDLLADAPTLPEGVEYALDESRGAHIYKRVHPEEQPRQVKAFRHAVLVEAQFPKAGLGGQSLPAQIEKWEEHETVGMYVRNVWTGALSLADKTALLNRVDKLMRGVIRARHQANSIEVVKATAGEEIFDYILGSASA